MDLGVQMSIDSRTFELSKRQFQMETMTQHALLYGYEISSDVPADGDCFFSIASLIYQAEMLMQSSQRQYGVNWWLSSKLRFVIFLGCYFQAVFLVMSNFCLIVVLILFIFWIFQSNSILIIFTWSLFLCNCNCYICNSKFNYNPQFIIVFNHSGFNFVLWNSRLFPVLVK